MSRRLRNWIIVSGFGVAFVVWSLLLLLWPPLLALDERLVAPPLDPMSNQAQIARQRSRC